MLPSQSRFREVGFVRFHAAPRRCDASWRTQLDALQAEFESLPIDAYDTTTRRYRRYSRGVLIPWSRRFEWTPSARDASGAEVSEYYQGASNPDYANRRRAFPALGEAARSSPLVLALVWCDFDQTFWSEHDSLTSIHVGVHFVKMMVTREGEEAVASPDHLHRDGEAFTFAHLVARRNAIGGVNTIAGPECVGRKADELSEERILARFTMTEPLDSYGVCDAMVSHHVSGITAWKAGARAERSTILIDFNPMVSNL